MIHTRIFIALLLTCAAVAGVGDNASAQDTPINDSQVIETLETRNEREAGDAAEQYRTALGKKLQERVYNLTKNITDRMNAAIDRLMNITNRLQSRTEKLAAEGVRDQEVLVKLSDARESLRAASTLLSEDLSDFIMQDNPRERFASVRATLKEAGAHIRDAHASLRDALAALKTAIRDAELSRGVSESVRNDATQETSN